MLRMTLLVVLLSLSAPVIQAADPVTELLTGGAEAAAVSDKVIAADSSSATDKKLQKRLQAIFAELDSLKGITIAVSNGVVTLTGEVDSSATHDKALQFARQLEGVVDVENDLQINREIGTRLETTGNRLLDMGKSLLGALPSLIMAIVVFAVLWWLGGWISRRGSLYRGITPNEFIANLLAQITRLFFALMGIVVALMLLDATALIGTILGAAGIVGLAVGFAVRDTVENFIASILLSLRNPFAVNDFVDIAGLQGNVAKLTSRATVLISPDGNHIRIPNSTVFKAVITNYTRLPERRFQFSLGVDTAQNLGEAQALALETLAGAEGVLADPAPMVLIDALGDSNVVLKVFAWVDQNRFSYGKVRSEAINAIKCAFDAAGVVMPEPIYNIRMLAQADGGPQTDKRADLPSAPGGESSAAPQDVSADRTVEEKVREAQSTDSSENLLHSKAPQEL